MQNKYNWTISCILVRPLNITSCNHTMKARLIFRVMCMLRGCRDSSFPNLYWYWISFVVIVLSAFLFYYYYSYHSYFYSVDRIKSNAELLVIKVHFINVQTKSHSCKIKIHFNISYGAQIINHLKGIFWAYSKYHWQR